MKAMWRIGLVAALALAVAVPEDPGRPGGEDGPGSESVRSEGGTQSAGSH